METGITILYIDCLIMYWFWFWNQRPMVLCVSIAICLWTFGWTLKIFQHWMTCFLGSFYGSVLDRLDFPISLCYHYNSWLLVILSYHQYCLWKCSTFWLKDYNLELMSFLRELCWLKLSGSCLLKTHLVAQLIMPRVHRLGRIPW